MKRRIEIAPLHIALILGMAFASHSCKDGDGGNDDVSPDSPPVRPADLTGNAIRDIKLLEAQVPLIGDLTPPPDAFPGYTPMASDLNEGTGGNYVWLYYKLGEADGSEGKLLGEIYTVDEREKEELKSEKDTQLPNNLTSGSPVVNAHKIYLAFNKTKWPVVRGIAVATVDTEEDTTVIEYAPPGIEKKYPVVWVQERKEDGEMEAAVPPGPWEPNPQDLNEGTSVFIPLPPFVILTDYIFIGYCVDQEYYDWLQKQ